MVEKHNYVVPDIILYIIFEVKKDVWNQTQDCRGSVSFFYCILYGRGSIVQSRFELWVIVSLYSSVR